MAVEIERKFLVNQEKWERIGKPKGKFFRQGYILTEPTKTIRVRLAEDRGFLTIKGKTIGATRAEYEYEIPVGEAAELLDQFSGAELSKIRYVIKIGNHDWEVDEFLGENSGLLVAEIELSHEDELFTLPDWVSDEVTSDNRYYNSNLVSNPFKNWE